VRGTRRYLLRCREPPGSAGKVRYLRIERPWLFVWHKICVGIRWSPYYVRVYPFSFPH
jgi:hypothetical protein